MFLNHKNNNMSFINQLQELLLLHNYDYNAVIKDLEKEFGIDLSHIKDDLIQYLKQNDLQAVEQLLLNYFYQELNNAHNMLQEIAQILAKYYYRSMANRRVHDIISSLKSQIEEYNIKIAKLKTELKQKNQLEKELVEDAIKALSELLATIAFISKIQKKYFEE